MRSRLWKAMPWLLAGMLAWAGASPGAAAQEGPEGATSLERPAWQVGDILAGLGRQRASSGERVRRATQIQNASASSARSSTARRQAMARPYRSVAWAKSPERK